MSDVEENNFEGRESRSQSKSPTGTPARVKSESRSASRSPSRVSKHSESHSQSRSKSRSRSRRHSHRRYTRSRSHSHSHRRRSRSRSYTPEYRRRRSRSHSPMSNRRRHTGSRANPDPNTCLGVFGLSLYTTERDLREVFSRYGPLSGVNVVYDQRTGRSRGFAFVYFERIDDSKEAMERANGMELDGRRIRVDYSITKRAHTPTPGIYMGRPTQDSFTLACISPFPAAVVVAAEVVEAVEAEVVGDAGTLTMTEDTTVAMTDTKTMITGTEDLHLLTTVDTGHGQDLVPIAQDAINGIVAVKDFFCSF
ncbi:transformer-2 protein homolog alpha isoform X2 [Ochotona curzoniae]|uniref:transformer-2 protein homolog alpha isoform X2 n=1 Tax=Ochotona curzoniae TaxID=130825 RepID=UPI001B353778|nr:transformer-2 protein homolog alpha isoform X2 [Ochotona curzoniae]